MRTETAVKRAKAFLNSHLWDMYELDNGEEGYDFTYNNQPFYVYYDAENHGCFSSEGKFCTENEVNEFISAQMSGDHREHWDNVIIFDVEKNEVVVPKIGL